jgi:hypothetical protein
MEPRNYNNGIRITQSPGFVIITVEMAHEARVIPTTPLPKLDSAIKEWLGESRGHWEGNTLVIETTNFNGKNPIQGSSENMKLTERFTRTDRDELRYEVAIDDPQTYARPWKISLPLTSPAGFYLLPYECHEGNYMLGSVLSAERTEDKALEEDLKKGNVRPRKLVQGLSIGGGPLGETFGPPPDPPAGATPAGTATPAGR